MSIVLVIVGAIVTGIIIGALARLVLPGRQNMSIAMTIGIGILGALIGGVIARAVHVGSVLGFVIQVAVAAVGVVLVAGRKS